MRHQQQKGAYPTIRCPKNKQKSHRCLVRIKHQKQNYKHSGISWVLFCTNNFATLLMFAIINIRSIRSNKNAWGCKGLILAQLKK